MQHDGLHVCLPVENISRKVTLAKDEDVAGHSSYLVVDYMHRILPVTPGTVVVPYYPCINDMVNVQGDDEDYLESKSFSFQYQKS